MNIEQIKTSELIPYAKNAKLHSDSQIAAIASSIREFQFNNPVLVDKDNGIIAGHGRVLAAQLLKLPTVPCIRLAHLTDTQKRAYILADNRLAETGGGWSEDLLKLELQDLQELDFDLALTGFDGEFIGSFDVAEVTPPELRDGDRAPFQQMTFTLHDSQAESIDCAVELAKAQGGDKSDLNENTNGNAIAFICDFFIRENS
jgi:ParB family transcriptional regulator, chromosome partitioning protein